MENRNFKRKSIFTHAEGTLYCNSLPKMVRFGFTLAEILIVISVIGVVAAITLPTLLKGVAERSNSEAEANAVQKVTKSMDLMRADGGLDRTYASTDEFVDELSKYLKITTRCNASNIENCWPTKTVTTSNGEIFEVKNAKTGKNLQINSNTTDNVGMILADGTCIIMTYNTNAELIGDGDTVHPQFVDLPIGFGRTKKFAYTTSVTNPIAFVMDVNGFRGPNSEERNGKQMDIRSFRGAKFSKACNGVNIDGIGCVTKLELPHTSLDTSKPENQVYDSKCTNDSNCTSLYYANNNWAGAKKACKDLGMELPDLTTLKHLYNKKAAVPILSASNLVYWSSTEIVASQAYAVRFSDGYSMYYGKDEYYHVLCVRD